MSKIVLGSTPKKITKDLSFPLLDGTVGKIEVDFIYRTRKAFAEFIDDHLVKMRAESTAAIEALKAKVADGDDSAASVVTEAELTLTTLDGQADFIMASVSGWNLDVKFDRDAVEQLVDEVPQAATAIIQSYRAAMTEGRLGN
ncbi:hypothetical protein ASF61_16780 [Duganella sp. Leaf126]|uniref:phage tail assembly chaperone n=1 Tax=Duganella sp. Leaf126 TaxID=1736266 RepID=UPI0006FE26F4|nr:phage tail assembly chaperone [Duganella sp. Leaf126]KQQ31989.1 hypothetical protein ASF61_16780 [Duganella sp. Leaf126]